MRFATVAFLLAAALISLPAPFATACGRYLVESLPAARPPRTSIDDRANLTVILNPVRPFRTFLEYLQQTNLVEVFDNQGYRTHHGITVFAPSDRAFAAVDPSVLSGLKKHQLRNLMMYHALARHYALKEFEALSQLSPVTTFAGGLYTVNLTFDEGDVHVRSRWAVAEVVGTVYATAPMAVYEIDRVLLPEAIFRDKPHVAVTLAPAPSPQDASDGGEATSLPGGGKARSGESSASRAGVRSAAIYAAAAAAALGAMTLVALCGGAPPIYSGRL